MLHFGATAVFPHQLLHLLLKTEELLLDHLPLSRRLQILVFAHWRSGGQRSLRVRVRLGVGLLSDARSSLRVTPREAEVPPR